MNPSPEFNPVPVILEGEHVRLEPLEISHADDLFEAGNDEAIWRYKLVAQPESVSDVRTWIDEILKSMANGREIAFAIIHKADKRAIGSTRYLDIQPAHKTIEIGWTWIGRNYQRTAVNTECKYLLLSHAFEKLGAVRVQLRTDMRNEKSKRAIERIGAIKEGVLRKSHTTHTGYVRDSVYYSIIGDEWPAVKQRLEGFLGCN
ncbi:MAG: GNAT family N-acetyltransferase [Planctomycetes bacterium]|nr:GNAT family N-acetyltransferase [Planctomycetota bacterium]